MALPLNLDCAEETQFWLIQFEATCRGKKIEDDNDGNLARTDKFIEKCGIKSLMKIASLIPGKIVNELPYEEIKKSILKYIQPAEKLVIAERTNFFQISQEFQETAQDCLAQLNKASVGCKFEQLKNVDDPVEEIIKLKLISGLVNSELKRKILEKVQIAGDLTSQQVVDFCLQCDQYEDFVNKKEIKEVSEAAEEVNFSKNRRKYVKEEKFKCNTCGSIHEKRECPAFNKRCTKCHRLHHFAKCCKSNGYNSESLHKVEHEIFCTSISGNNALTNARLNSRDMKFLS